MYRKLPIGVFWIIKNVCNLNRFAFQQNAANYTARPGSNNIPFWLSMNSS